VFVLSEVPLKVAWATKNQLFHIANEAAVQKVLGAYLDSTGKMFGHNCFPIKSYNFGQE